MVAVYLGGVPCMIWFACPCLISFMLFHAVLLFVGRLTVVPLHNEGG